jgi:hypothetical protein
MPDTRRHTELPPRSEQPQPNDGGGCDENKPADETPDEYRIAWAEYAQ